MTQRPVAVRVITWLPVGGIERRLVAVVPRLRDLGWDMRVICLREEGPLGAELRAAGIPLQVIPFRSRLSPRALGQLAGYFRSQNASVVHSHMYRSNLPATVAGRLAGVPAIFAQVHNVDSWDSRRQRFMDRLSARWRTATLAVSRAVQQDVMAALGQPEERVPVLYNGIDVAQFRPRPEAGQALRDSLGVDPNQVLFMVPARLHPQKNPAGVMAAFEQMAAACPEGVRPVLAFAGGGKLEAELRERAAALAARVLFLGQRDDMVAVYNAADAVVLSSFKEGFSNAVVEALACGRPVIASDVGGNREAVNEPAFGWIHAAGDEAMLQTQLREAVELGRDGLRAREDVCRARSQDFSIDALVKRTHQLYSKALGRPE